MKISVVVPCRENIPQQLLDNLWGQTFPPNEIIEVVGNSLTIQRKEGIKQSSGDIIIFIDDDLILDKNYLWEIMETFFLHPDAMAVTGNVEAIMYRPNLFYTIFAHIFFLTYMGKGKFLISGFPQNYHQKITRTIKGEMLNGCNMAIRREIFKEFSFNENLESGMYGEDDYFAYQLTRKYNVYYNPNARCYDDRPYPWGKQAWKVRCTILNLVTRYRNRRTNLMGKMAFWWAMTGFIIFKIMEAIVMKDVSIIKGIKNCSKTFPYLPIIKKVEIYTR